MGFGWVFGRFWVGFGWVLEVLGGFLVDFGWLGFWLGKAGCFFWDCFSFYF